MDGERLRITPQLRVISIVIIFIVTGKHLPSFLRATLAPLS